VTEEKKEKEKGTPNSLLINKKNPLEKPPLQKPKTLHKQGSQIINPVLKSETLLPINGPTQSLSNIPQKTVENIENPMEKTPPLPNVISLAKFEFYKENNEGVVTDLEERKDENIMSDNIDKVQSAKVNGFRIKTKVFNVKQSPVLNNDEKSDEIVKISALETNTILSNATTETQSKPLEPSSYTSSNQNMENGGKKISIMTKNGQIFKRLVVFFF